MKRKNAEPSSLLPTPRSATQGNTHTALLCSQFYAKKYVDVDKMILICPEYKKKHLNIELHFISDSCPPGVSQWCSTAGDSSPLAAITLNLSDYGASHGAGTQPGHHSTVQYSTVQRSTTPPYSLH